MKSQQTDWFSRLWSTRHDPRTVPKKPPAKATRPSETKEDRARNAIIDAAERRRRQWQKYVHARKYRLDELARDYPSVRTYRATLRSLIRDPATEWTGPRDCNIDLAGLCEDLGLDRIERDYDRMLILEITRDAVTAIGRRQNIPPERLIDDPVPLPAPGESTETEVDRVKKVLRLV